MPLRLGLLRMPQLLADAVRSAFAQEGAEFDEFTDVPAVEAREERTGAGHDAVIVCVEDRWDTDVVELNRMHPALTVFGRRRDGRRTWLYLLLPQPCLLGELGPHELRARLLNEVRLGLGVRWGPRPVGWIASNVETTTEKP